MSSTLEAGKFLFPSRKWSSDGVLVVVVVKEMLEKMISIFLREEWSEKLACPGHRKKV